MFFGMNNPFANAGGLDLDYVFYTVRDNGCQFTKISKINAPIYMGAFSPFGAAFFAVAITCLRG